MAEKTVMEKLVSLCKRRGIIFQSSEIYGGLSSAWDYGPLGVQLKNHVRDFWWREMTQLHDDIVGLDAAIMMHPKVWEASGHVENFTDPLVDCKSCKHRFREDQIPEEKRESRTCPDCGGDLTDARQFNLMFQTHLGPVEDGGDVVFLRPETAQGIYVNFRNVVQSSRVKIPFGIAQIGKAFRNEITTKNFIFRTCEFEQMEMQYFVHPSEDEKWFEYWLAQRQVYYQNLGIRPDKLRLHEHGPDELAHYAKVAYDIEYEFPFGWSELEGIANRTDFDLTQHINHSGKDLSYRDPQTNEKYVPYCIEASAGVDRTVLTVLSDAYTEDEVEGEKRTLLRFHPRVAPITTAVFPLMKKPELQELAHKIEKDLRELGRMRTFYDEAGNIGRRYRRQDEIGTPFCVTVDPETLEDRAVTIRDRDTLAQDRVSIDQLIPALHERMRQK